MSPEKGSRGPKPKETTEDIKEAIRTAEDPVVTISELAEMVSITRQALDNRRDELRNDDEIRSSDKGGTEVFWHILVDKKTSWSNALGHGMEDDDDDEDIDPEIGIPAIDELDVDGSGEIEKIRRGAIHIAFKYMMLNDTASKDELSYLLDSFPFNDTYDSDEGLWNSCIQRALRESEYFQHVPHADHYEWANRAQRNGLRQWL